MKIDWKSLKDICLNKINQTSYGNLTMLSILFEFTLSSMKKWMWHRTWNKLFMSNEDECFFQLKLLKSKQNISSLNVGKNTIFRSNLRVSIYCKSRMSFFPKKKFKINCNCNFLNVLIKKFMSRNIKTW